MYMFYYILVCGVQSFLAADDTVLDHHVGLPSDEDMYHCDEGTCIVEYYLVVR